MSAPGLAGHGPIRQIAWVTDDLDASIDDWRRMTGAGPWTVYRYVRLDGLFRGAPATVTIDVGLAYHHDMQIELIMPHGTGPSPYHRADGSAMAGQHHVAWIVTDFTAAVDRAIAAGLEPLFRAKSGPAKRGAYFVPQGGASPLLELIEATPELTEGFAQGIAAARGWNGDDPVTIVDLAS